MKFEKLSEYKLRVTVSNAELLENSNGDLDNFMSNPTKARKSFLEILDKAEDEVGFHIDNSRIRIDAKSMYNGDFIFTITKLIPKGSKKVKPVKVPIQKDNTLVYSFVDIEHFFNFCNFLKKQKINRLREFCKTIELYKYNGKYVLICLNINQNYRYLGMLYSGITEFGNFLTSQESVATLIKERGTLVIGHNAIYTIKNHNILLDISANGCGASIFGYN